VELKFTIFGIPVRIHLYFLIIVVFLSTTRIAHPALILSWTIVVVVSVILHELGHALAARAFGHSPSIELKGIGGATYTQRDDSRLLESITISLAGPLTGIIIGLSALWVESAVSVSSPVFAVIIGDIVWVNLYWSLANLAPVLPLDGGNIVLALLNRVFKNKGRMIASIISLGLTVPLIVYCLLHNYLFITLLLGFFAVYNLGQFRYYRSRGVDAHKLQGLRDGYALLQTKKYDQAVELGNRLLAQTENPRVRADVLNLLGWAYFLKQDFDSALSLYHDYPPGIKQDQRLLAFLYFNTHNFEKACRHFQNIFYAANDRQVAEYYMLSLLECVRLDEAYKAAEYAHMNISTPSLQSLGTLLYKKEQFTRSFHINTLIYSRDRSADAAYNAACALARSGDKNRACSWLKKALKSGFKNTQHLRADPDLEPLHSMPCFEKIIREAE
jgi:tetratricopeptide (TPR) repeat protein